mgnify:CR=1 FL=1
MKIYIYGAGSIGCYLGGRLVAAGNDVTFITRPRIHAELSQWGLVLTDYLGKKYQTCTPSTKTNDRSYSGCGCRCYFNLCEIGSNGTSCA